MESTQERIIAAARRLFGENGFRGTTTAEIARSAGVAEGSIYRYFKDKKELFVACVEPVLQEVVRRETVVTGSSPRELLRNRIIERTKVIQEHMDVFNILFTEGHRHPELAAMMIRQANAMVPEHELETVKRAVATGALKRPPHPLIMTIGLTAAIWAMLAAGPASALMFPGWPVTPRFESLPEDVADFVCFALIGDEPPITE